MGIDIHTLSFLKYASSKKKFGNTMTIGRQEIHIGQDKINYTLNSTHDYSKDIFCENMLRNEFQATAVDSIDISNFEAATHIADLNLPLKESDFLKYDTVFDGGCLEHIYNAPQALKNCSSLTNLGGQILHVLPGNNFCGHGFWQFSPELFFSLYSISNGYDDTEVFLADLGDSQNWYKVIKPVDGARINIYSSRAIYILVRTTLSRLDFLHNNIQQGNYLQEWEIGHVPFHKISIKNRLMTILREIPFYNTFKRFNFLAESFAKDRLNSKNPNLIRLNIKDVLNF